MLEKLAEAVRAPVLAANAIGESGRVSACRRTADRGILVLNSSITTAQKGVCWNPACARFDAAAWHAKVGEMAAIGLEYLVLMAVALDFKTFYPSRLLPAWEMACPDPRGAPTGGR